MTQSLSHQLDVTARNLVPAALGVFLAVLSAIPFYLPGYGPVAPNFVLMVVFFWAVHRPDILSPVRVFFIGLLLDILVGMPPGLNAAVLVLVWALTSTQNKVFRGKSFLVLWWGFGLVALTASFAVWLLSCLYNLALLDPLPGLFQAAVTIALFPFLAWLFVWTQHKLLPQG